MTIIAANADYMVADSWCFQGSLGFPCLTPKITRTENGLFGACGHSIDADMLRKWANDGADFSNAPKFSCMDTANEDSLLWLWLHISGKLYMGDCSMRHHECPKYTGIGYGVEFMQGAVAAGVSLYSAVTLTIPRHAFLGGDIQIEYLHHKE